MANQIFPLLQGASLDHVAVAVRDVRAAAHFFRDVLGGEFLMGVKDPAQQFLSIQYRFPGGGKVELLAALGEGFISRFLDQRGEGMHHITLRVDHIEEQIHRLRHAGIPLILVSLSNPDWREAFIHPSDCHGVLVQLAEWPYSDEESARHFTELFPEAALLESL